MCGFIYVKLSGLNLFKIINTLVNKGVYIDDVSMKALAVKFRISVNDFYILKKVCKNEHKKIEIIYKSRIKNLLLKFKYLIGFFY